jgi:hypothetical protein
MRATRFVTTLVALTLDLCLPGLIAGQANWTPTIPEHRAQPLSGCNPLGAVSVRMVTLNPGSAQKHYKIKLSSEAQFVIVEHISPAIPGSETGCYHGPGYGSVKIGDLVDTIALPGEIPEHGQIKTIADFERVASLCTPGCLIFVRHKDNGGMSDIVQQGKPKLVSYDGIHACDTKTRYVYNIHFDPSRGQETENWLPPSDYPRVCTYHAPPIVTSQPYSIPPIEANSVEEEIAAIRAAPHEAMPPAQPAGAALGGQSSMTVKNGTSYSLYVFFAGPISQKLEIAAGQSQTVSLLPGHYEVAAKVSNPSVIPFYGVEDYGANTGYSSHFYIATQPR